MAKRLPRVSILVFLGLVAFFFVGCAPKQIDRTSRMLQKVDGSSVLIELLPSKKVEVATAQAYLDGDDIVIKGDVKRSFINCCKSARGHVDLALFGPDEGLLDMISTTYDPRNIPKGSNRTSQFLAKLPHLPLEKITIRLVYHDTLKPTETGSEYKEEMFDCDRNLAVPHGQGVALL